MARPDPPSAALLSAHHRPPARRDGTRHRPAQVLDEEGRRYHGLALLACGLARRALQVQPLLRPPGPAAPQAPPLPPRAVLVAAAPGQGTMARLLVPTLADAASAPRGRLHAAMVAHAVAHLWHSPAGQSSAALKPLGLTVVSALEDARVERLLCRDYPGVRRWFEACVAAAPDAADLTFRAFMARLDRMLLLPGCADGNHWVNKARELFEQAAVRHGLEDYAAFRAAASVLANDLGQMRIRMEPQHYTVPSAYRDDNSYLWQHPESEQAADEPLALQQGGAGSSPSSSPPPAAAAVQDTELARYLYPEWDRRLERMKPDWCTVVERPPTWQGQGAAPDARPPAARKLAGMLLPRARQLDRRHRLRRQWEGDDVDLNAAIEVLVDRRLGLRPDPRLFMRAGKGPRPTSLLVLMDVSESVNDLGADGIALLDIEKQAALMLAQAQVRGVDRLAIHAFSSNTRAEVNYYRLLDFGQACSPATMAGVQAMRGRYSTRLGAALRHAASLLAAEPAGQRAMLVISDGAPSDIDVHDGRYLIEDARHAVQEAARTGIRTSCLAVDGQADAYLRHIFGWRGHAIADDPRHVPQRLAQMSARLAAGR